MAQAPIILQGIPRASCSNSECSLCPLCSLGNLSKTCTEDGWTNISVDSYVMDCGYNPNNTMDDNVVSFQSYETPPGAHVAAAAAAVCSDKLLSWRLNECAFLFSYFFFLRENSSVPSKWATPSATACRSSRLPSPSSYSVSFGKQGPTKCDSGPVPLLILPFPYSLASGTKSQGGSG